MLVKDRRGIFFFLCFVVAHYHDILAYDASFQTVVEWAKADGDTLVIATADHETGGLGLGLDGVYDFDPDDQIPKIKHSAEFMMTELNGNLSNAGARLGKGEKREKRSYFFAIAPIVQKYTPGFYLTTEEITHIDNAIQQSGSSGAEYAGGVALGQVLSRRVQVGWTTTGHTAVDVNLYAFGPLSHQ